MTKDSSIHQIGLCLVNELVLGLGSADCSLVGTDSLHCIVKARNSQVSHKLPVLLPPISLSLDHTQKSLYSRLCNVARDSLMTALSLLVTGRLIY